MKYVFGFLALIFLVSGCRKASEENLLDKDFSLIESKAQSTTVNFFMWGGSVSINNWIDTFVVGELKKKYNITLVRTPSDASVFVNKLLTEKQAGIQKGSIDLVWINGENFKNAIENGLLYGPYADKLPNYRDYVDPDTVSYDFGYPVNGYESPYGKAQFVFEYDSALIPSPPDTFEGLKEWIIKNPGKFSYPQPPDFTGSAFIRQVFYAVTGGHQQYLEGFDEALFSQKTPALWSYLNDIRPYLWQKGRTYPKDIAMLDTLFENGEVSFNMSYHQANAQNRILQGKYKKTVKTFAMKDGSIYNIHFTAIPFNAPNKAGAMTVANFLLSPDAQLSKNDPANWGDFTVLDLSRLSPEDQERFKQLNLGEATLGLDILSQTQVPEIPSVFVEKLEDGWNDKVLIQQ
jgi:putative spermidine/putrescine transport system substrate-binding protein